MQLTDLSNEKKSKIIGILKLKGYSNTAQVLNERGKENGDSESFGDYHRGTANQRLSSNF